MKIGSQSSKSKILSSLSRVSILKTFLKFIGGLILAVIVLLIGGFAVFVLAAGPDTDLKSKFEQCVEARANGTAQSISDFICPSGKVSSQYDIAYQIAVDIAFRKLDREVETALQGYQ